MIALGVGALLPVAAQANCGTCATKAEGCCSTAKATVATAATTAGTCAATAATAAGTCAATAATAATAAKAPADQPGMAKVAYRVSGMSCGACETKLTKALTGLKGVAQAEACAESKQAKLVYDPKQVKEKQFVAAIKEAGFKAESAQLEVKVGGMSCGACSQKVSKALTALEGVKEQQVCHVGKKAVVTFDPNKVNRQQIVATIDQTGFKTE